MLGDVKRGRRAMAERVGQAAKTKTKARTGRAEKAARAVKVGKLRFPLDRSYFTRKGAHLWLLPQKDGTVKIGMDSFIAESAGYLNYIMLDRCPSVKRGASLGSFESAKFVSKLFSPVSGMLVGVNEQVIRDPRRINKDPYGSWILSLRPKDNAKDLGSPELLKDEKEIRAWIQAELARADDEC